MMNQIIEADVRAGLVQVPNEHINMVMTSVPYWSLRCYNTEPQIWGGDKNCEHIWQKHITPAKGGVPTRIAGTGRDETMKTEKSSFLKTPQTSAFCSKCSAWRGELGLEPTIELYIAHLMECFDALRPKLRKDGLLFVNIADTYNSHFAKSKNVGGFDGENMKKNPNYAASRIIGKQRCSLPNKSLCLIPERFAIAMVERGWILRSTIIWVKSISFAEHDCQHCHQITQYSGSCMPDSARDRPNKNGFEFIFMFSKQSKPTCWVNEKTGLSADRPVNFITGIENVDWEWKRCPNCKGAACKRCKGLGKYKSNFWSSRDYFYEQQYEEAAYDGRQDTTLKPTEKYGQRNFGNPQQMERQPMERWPTKIKRHRLNPETKPCAERGRSPNDYAGQLVEIDGENVCGRIIRNAWAINSQSTSEKHYATFPEELVEKCIRIGCPREICKRCNKPRYPIYQPAEEYKKKLGTWTADTDKNKTLRGEIGFAANTKQIACTSDYKITYSDCGCGAGFRPSVVCDPFSGIATTGKVAYRLGMDYIGIELSPVYNEIARRQLKEQRGLFDNDFEITESTEDSKDTI